MQASGFSDGPLLKRGAKGKKATRWVAPKPEVDPESELPTPREPDIPDLKNDDFLKVSLWIDDNTMKLAYMEKMYAAYLNKDFKIIFLELIARPDDDLTQLFGFSALSRLPRRRGRGGCVAHTGGANAQAHGRLAMVDCDFEAQLQQHACHGTLVEEQHAALHGRQRPQTRGRVAQGSYVSRQAHEASVNTNEPTPDPATTHPTLTATGRTHAGVISRPQSPAVEPG